MCLICVDFQKENLTTTEAWRNLQEMKESMTDEHYDEVVVMIIEGIHNEIDESSGEEELSKLLTSLDETGQLNFGWDEPEYLGLEDDEDFDLDYPGEFFED